MTDTPENDKPINENQPQDETPVTPETPEEDFDIGGEDDPLAKLMERFTPAETAEGIRAENAGLRRRIDSSTNASRILANNIVTLAARLAEAEAEKADAEFAIAEARLQTVRDFAAPLAALANAAIEDVRSMIAAATDAETFKKSASGLMMPIKKLSTLFQSAVEKTASKADAAAVETIAAPAIEESSTIPQAADDDIEALKAEREALNALLPRAEAQQQEMSRRFRGLRQQVESAREAATKLRGDAGRKNPFAIEGVVKAAIPAIDDIERGITILTTLTEKDATIAPLRDKAQAICETITAAFAAAGVRQINPVGQPYHDDYEAVSTVSKPGVGDEIVVEVVGKGYEIAAGDARKTLRNARVIVNMQA